MSVSQMKPSDIFVSCVLSNPVSLVSGLIRDGYIVMTDRFSVGSYRSALPGDKFVLFDRGDAVTFFHSQEAARAFVLHVRGAKLIAAIDRLFE